MLFAISLTLPAFADTGPPAPKTQTIVKDYHEQSDIVISTISSEAPTDVGLSLVYTAGNENSKDYYPDLEKADQQFYLGKPERLCPAQFGYIAKRPCKEVVNKIRPPSKRE